MGPYSSEASEAPTLGAGQGVTVLLCTKGGGQVKGFTARVGNMSSGTCMRERERIVVKGRVRKLSRAPGSLGVVLC